MMGQRLLPTYTALVILASGCTHTQLRWNTVHQAQTLSDVCQNQVLNNLAKFVYDRNALPDFSFPNAGASSVLDSGNLGLLFTWLWTGTGSNSLNGAVSRTASESWTLTPVTDPRKLELMRCAYQKAVASCHGWLESAQCPDCAKRWNSFYTGEPYKKDADRKPLAAPRNLVPFPGDAEADGRVTSECLSADCWFHVGCKKDVPKHCPCTHVGHYCGVYVWVTPARGTDELTKLTLAILDYAVNEPTRAAQKEIEAEYVYDSTADEAKLKSWRETYLAPVDAKPKPVREKRWPGEPDAVPPEATQVFPGGRTPQPGAAFPQFEQERRALVPF